MRSHFAKQIEQDEYLLHADMFNILKFPTKAKVINTGLGEANLLNIASGIARNGCTVHIYGVAGFIIHRLEQLKFSAKYFGAEKGKIIIYNAGRVGYSKLGLGHKLDDDIQIMDMLDIVSFTPETLEDLRTILKGIKNEKSGIFYIQLGKDF